MARATSDIDGTVEARASTSSQAVSRIRSRVLDTCQAYEIACLLVGCQASDLRGEMDPTTAVETVIASLQEAWNAADGAAFGASFAPDADFVTIRGELHSAEAIGVGHQQIFDPIYAGSTVQYTVLKARELDDRVILAHVRGKLSVPAGPMAGEADALASVVLIHDGHDHQITAFHNTLVASS